MHELRLLCAQFQDHVAAPRQKTAITVRWCGVWVWQGWHHITRNVMLDADLLSLVHHCKWENMTSIVSWSVGVGTGNAIHGESNEGVLTFAPAGRSSSWKLYVGGGYSGAGCRTRGFCLAASWLRMIHVPSRSVISAPGKMMMMARFCN